MSTFYNTYSFNAKKDVNNNNLKDKNFNEIKGPSHSSSEAESPTTNEAEKNSEIEPGNDIKLVSKLIDFKFFIKQVYF